MKPSFTSTSQRLTECLSNIVPKYGCFCCSVRTLLSREVFQSLGEPPTNIFNGNYCDLHSWNSSRCKMLHLKFWPFCDGMSSFSIFFGDWADWSLHDYQLSWSYLWFYKSLIYLLFLRLNICWIAWNQADWWTLIVSESEKIPGKEYLLETNTSKEGIGFRIDEICWDESRRLWGCILFFGFTCKSLLTAEALGRVYPH